MNTAHKPSGMPAAVRDGDRHGVLAVLPLVRALAPGLLLALLLGLSLPGWADEDDDNDETARREAPAETAPEARPSGDRPFEVFVPSEQISEDLPVTFPVDI